MGIMYIIERAFSVLFDAHTNLEKYFIGNKVQIYYQNE